MRNAVGTYGIAPSELADMRVSFLIGLAGEEAGGGSGIETTNVGYKEQFIHAWKWRFRWMFPADRELALAAEWARYERGEPAYYDGEK